MYRTESFDAGDLKTRTMRPDERFLVGGNSSNHNGCMRDWATPPTETSPPALSCSLLANDYIINLEKSLKNIDEPWKRLAP